MEAYPIPFRVDRDDAPVYRFVNTGPETLRGVSALLLGPGVMPVGLPMVLRPSDAMELTIRGRDLELATSVVIRWLRPNDEEYAWRTVF